MKKKVAFTFLFFMLMLLAAFPANDKKLYRQADVHFANREWNEALMIYDKLLVTDKKNVSLYVGAIVSASEVKSPQSVLHYIELSEANGVSLDSLFVSVDRKSHILRNSAIYENMLLMMKQQQPWLKSLINRYLLNYYLFRHDSEGVIAVTGELLEQLPDNMDFLKARGDALFEVGRERESVEYFNRMLEIDDKNLDAYIFLGIYNFWKGSLEMKKINNEFNRLVTPTRMQYASHRKKQRDLLDTRFAASEKYLEKALAIKPTPYIRDVLYNIYVQRSEVDKAQAIKRAKARKQLL